MINCDTLGKFIKCERKRWRKHYHRTHSQYPIWISCIIDTTEKIEESFKHKKYLSKCINLPIILTELKTHFGKIIFCDGYHEYGILTGVEITNEDYYWCYTNKDNIKRCFSCVGHIDFISDEEVLRKVNNC